MSEQITERRLCWPEWLPRTPEDERRMASFVTPMHKAVAGIEREVRLLRGSDLVITCDGLRGRSGQLLGQQPRTIDPGAAIYFTLNGDRVVFAIDKWNQLVDNLQAIHKHLDAMRGQIRWGAQQLVDRAMTAFKALPAPSPAEIARPWHEVLHVAPDADPAVIEAAYRALAKVAHPDRGGDAARFRAITAAYQEARAVAR